MARLNNTLSTQTFSLEDQIRRDQNTPLDFRGTVQDDAGIEKALAAVLRQVVYNSRLRSFGQAFMGSAKVFERRAIRSCSKFTIHLEKQRMRFRVYLGRGCGHGLPHTSHDLRRPVLSLVDPKKADLKPIRPQQDVRIELVNFATEPLILQGTIAQADVGEGDVERIEL